MAKQLPLRHRTLPAGDANQPKLQDLQLSQRKKPGDGSDATAISSTSYLPNAVPMELSLASIPRPSDVVIMQETIRLVSFTALRPGIATDFGLCPGGYTFWHVNLKPGTDWYSDIHNRGGNLVFVDGHAQYRKAKQLRARDFGLTDGSSGKADDDQKRAIPPVTGAISTSPEGCGRQALRPHRLFL